MFNKLKIFYKIKLNREQSLIIIYVSLILLFNNICIDAQSKPATIQPRSVSSKLHKNNILSVNSSSIIQNLSFGAFYTGSSGGKVNISSTGSRSVTGDIILIPSEQGTPAVIQITTDNTDYITITTAGSVTLTNGSGGTITLEINDFYPVSPFNPVVGLNNVKIGGTLTVGSSANTPPGNYNGSFEVIFNEQ
jgi:hypothetical protein